MTQHYCCVMIPDMINIPDAPWSVLPPGIHLASLVEVQDRFATNPHRRKLFGGLIAVSAALSRAGCRRLYIDGSYVTGKPKPGDFDGCWDPTGVQRHLLDPVLLDFKNGRARQKAKFLGELFLFQSLAAPGKTFMDFFQTERYSGGKKGIIAVDLTLESFDLVKGDKA